MELEVGIKEGNWNRKELGLRSSTGRTRSPEVENQRVYWNLILKINKQIGLAADCSNYDKLSEVISFTIAAKTLPSHHVM
ncbi:hypothetical protein YC2023_034471 [Brassica napus]